MTIISRVTIKSVERKHVLVQFLSPTRLSVCVSASVCPVYCGKTTDWTWMLFGLVGQLGPRMRQIVGIGNGPVGKGNFGGGYGASNCNQWGLCGIVMQKCVKRSICHLGW